MISGSARRRVELSLLTALSWRPSAINLLGLLRSIVTSWIALGVTFYLLPGRQSSGPWAVALLALVVFGTGLVLRPLLLGLAVLLGSAGMLLVALVAQAGVLAVALTIAPDVHVDRFSTIFGAAWIATAVAAVVNWLLDAGSQDVYLAQVLGRVVRVSHRFARDPAAPHDEPGMVVIQLDGVGADVLRQASVSGAVPTLARWVRGGSHRGYRWHTGLPSTTPAGQAVLLHGDEHEIPCFRWYDKLAGRMFVANNPSDARLIEQRISTGRGLLADGGVSVSNLFSGDAPDRLLVMSDARLPSRATRGLATFATASVGLTRTIVTFLGQVVAEVYQSRRQRRRDVRPRVRRGPLFALLRGVTTALLHDLNVAIVAEQMARGAPVIYVDFVDYDEVAHHAGPTRAEAMRSLDALDRVLRFVAKVAAETVRRYEIVVVSDHGQCQGAPFAQLSGHSLESVVASLTDAGEAPESHPAERYGPVNVLLTGAARSAGRGLGTLARRRGEEVTDHEGRPDVSVDLGGKAARADGPEPIIAAGGSLAHLYLPGVDGRATRAQIDAAHPGLVDGLAAQHGVGLVMVREAEGPVVIGATGRRSLVSGAGAGDNPLDPYGPRAAADLLALDARAHVGDLVVLGRHDPETGETAAFEELVGSHGGLGGDQTNGVLLVPNDWPSLGVSPLSGAQVHRALTARLEALGLRRPDPAPAPANDRAEVAR